ncbi:MAG TPA: protein kinase [Bryobacteraceae bacterium]|nr:protein kinase [Bryobacteraceae bacterium]
MIGSIIGHYEVLKQIGAGGMGVVYQARDLELGRLVAIKVLPSNYEADPDRKRRFLNEARAASALNHPNIVTIHEIGHAGETDFIVMEYVEGRPLSELINPNGLPVEQAVNYTLQIAKALAAAHAAGITHRDIKPANILISSDGITKIVDFGLAKQETQVGPEAATMTSAGTEGGIVVGTPFYMSPEQAEGKPADARSDIFSLGVVFYEMLSGRKPFQGDSQMRTLLAIIAESPAPIKAPRELAGIVSASLEKNREKRPRSIEVVAALTKHSAAATPRAAAFQRRWPWFAIATVVTVALLFGVLWRTLLGPVPRSKRSIAEIGRLVSAGDSFQAVVLGRKIQPYVADDPDFRRIWADIARFIDVTTEPAGARIYYKAYGSPDSAWLFAGQSPLQNLPIPYSWKFLIKAEKDGYEPAYGGAIVRAFPPKRPSLHFRLDPRGSTPQGMVPVQAPATRGGIVLANGLPPLGSVAGGFYIDRDEVTNAEYKKFVDAGGYEKAEFWKEPFIKDGRAISWKDAMEEFRDKSGRPAPATWEVGTFPEGHAGDPVNGVSWYEAAAYAEFAGKKLPTLAHWIQAAFWNIEYAAPLSNFSGKGPVPAGTYPGTGNYNTRDMAGNVKEWCWNQNESGLRFILGGDFSDPVHQATKLRVLSPFDRSVGNGFRCVRPRQPLDAAALAPKTIRVLDVPKPVSDEAFQGYRDSFAYDPVDLDIRTEAPTREEADWRVEKVSFVSAYPNTRIPTYVYLPKNARPPYQTIVYFPPQVAEYLDVFSANVNIFNYLLRSGRAIVFPIYEGTYERTREFPPAPTAEVVFKQLIVRRVQDAQRAVDFISSRPDLDATRVGYLGTSLGAAYGPLVVAVDSRFRAAVLHDGGLVVLRNLLSAPLMPEVNQAPFAARVKVPVLMINGTFDNIFPPDIAQKPMFDLFATPANQKRYVQLSTAHGVLADDRPRVVRETLDWFDKYLGAVAR